MTAPTRNRRTVEAYDAYATRYAEATADGRSTSGAEALAAFIAIVGPGADVLEVGSGPGWDADLLESEGVIVKRTDLSTGFIDFQAGRGKMVDRLDLITDDLGGPYAGFVALYVIQHVERDRVDGVISKISASLRNRGTLLLSFQLGEGERTEMASDGGIYHVVSWDHDAMIACLGRHGLRVVWERDTEDEEGRWTTLIARRP